MLPPVDTNLLLKVIDENHDKFGTKCRVESYAMPTAVKEGEAPELKCVSEDGKHSFNATADQLAPAKKSDQLPVRITGPNLK